MSFIRVYKLSSAIRDSLSAKQAFRPAKRARPLDFAHFANVWFIFNFTLDIEIPDSGISIVEISFLAATIPNPLAIILLNDLRIKKSRTMNNKTIISKENKFLTLINIFTVDPNNQQKLIDLLKLATESSVKNIPGFISSSLHRSIDGTKVTMYAQWRSVQEYQNMRNNSTASPYLTQALEFAKFEMGMYEVVETFRPDI